MIELTDKLKVAEKKLSDYREQCEKLNAELEKLTSANSTIQEDHVNELHK